jgi:hypothetical protein
MVANRYQKRKSHMESWIIRLSILRSSLLRRTGAKATAGQAGVMGRKYAGVPKLKLTKGLPTYFE